MKAVEMFFPSFQTQPYSVYSVFFCVVYIPVFFPKTDIFRGKRLLEEIVEFLQNSIAFFL